MAKTRVSGQAIVVGIFLVALAIGITVAGQLPPREIAPEGILLVSPEEAPVCSVEASPVSLEKAMAPGEPLAPGGCKACKNRPWCGCSYQGHPRISCNPCCYQAYPFPICFD